MLEMRVEVALENAKKTEIKLAFQKIRCFLLELRNRKTLEKDAKY